LVDAGLSAVQTIYLKLSESEANVTSVSQKVQEHLDSEEDIVLTDCKGQEIHDSQGTQGKP
jgi:mannose/fructose-specific phosphotransferase system component IIA